MTDVTSTKNMVWRRPGRVMWRKRCHGPAPSTRAASYQSRGMAARPAWKTTIW